MSWFSRLFGEDKAVQCGVWLFHLYRFPRNDPYIEACAFDDKATTEGSSQQKAGISVSRLAQHFSDMIDEIDLRKGRKPNGDLARFYKFMHRNFLSFFYKPDK